MTSFIQMPARVVYDACCGYFANKARDSKQLREEVIQDLMRRRRFILFGPYPTRAQVEERQATIDDYVATGQSDEYLWNKQVHDLQVLALAAIHHYGADDAVVSVSAPDARILFGDL